jgi:NAD(P)-dependent dehydrogenase (short-subunit alcohol dehydrogenase family)
MIDSARPGVIVNHCFLPSMYAGTEIGNYFPMLKGAVTGLTRGLCRRYGKDGIRVNTVMTGLIDMPETRAMASPEVKAAKVPVGRWGTPAEIAKFVAFVALKCTYISGQCLIVDGGLTSGTTGV